MHNQHQRRMGKVTAQKRTDTVIRVWTIHEARPQNNKIEPIEEIVNQQSSLSSKNQLLDSSENPQRLMPPETYSTPWLYPTFLVLGTFTQRSVERMMNPDICLDFSSGGLFSNESGYATREADNNLYRSRFKTLFRTEKSLFRNNGAKANLDSRTSSERSGQTSPVKSNTYS